MSFKPDIITNEEIEKQVAALLLKRDELTLTRDQMAERLRTIEHIINENAALAQKTKEQVAESVGLFLEEWKTAKENYPEVRLGIIQKALDLFTIDEEKKKKK